MDIVQNKWKQVGLLFLGVAIVAILIWLLVYAIRTSRTLATPDVIKRVQDDQLAKLTARWTGITQNRQGLSQPFSAIPDDQRLLINASVLSTRLLGYSGPYTSGVFDEDNATRLALSSGARCLVLEIDRETGGQEPLLIYRDSWGVRQSLNAGSLEKVAKSISGRAFKPEHDSVPPTVASDPLILVLYFVNTPSMGDKPADYVRFLAKVAEKLQPLKGLLVSQTPFGDFRRQALESQLCFVPWTTFTNRILVFTNADTTAFRRLQSLGLAGEIGASGDLDVMVHARMYSKESPSSLGISSTPTTTGKPAVVITTPNYWLQMPPDRIADAQSQTKQQWTLVMEPIASEQGGFDTTQVKDLFTKYGVQSVPLVLFDEPAKTDVFVGKEAPFAKASWSVKPELIRFIPPAPIVVQKPLPQTNSGGGAVVAPRA